MNVKGFHAAAVEAGIRYQNRLDLALIFSEVPAVAAGVFTTNKVKAAPVLLDIERLRHGRAQAILVNSGNANACTGQPGMETAIRSAALTAQRLGIEEELVMVSSTGVIGEQLDAGKIEAALPALAKGLGADGFTAFAQAIMTTDTVPKTSFRQISIGGKEVNLLGIAKGSGMIMPDMATMLCFLVTDAQVVFPELRDIIRQAADRTFNRITVDGDTSTNDMILAMANGMAGNQWIDDDFPEGRALFAEAVESIFLDLALAIVRDGEGATKLVTIRIVGARSQEDAMGAAQTIANSALVKTAFNGADPNWGRIIAALGRSDCYFLPDKVAIYFDEVKIVENGMGLGPDAEAAGAAVLRKESYAVTIDLGGGSLVWEVYTCDFSKKYVEINASYKS